jgi:flagellar biosynthesis/type III secretory pathway protein FliH
MSSTGPIPQPGAEVLTRYLDILGQQQQEMIQKLTLAQQQAAMPVPMKTLPTPGLTAEALQAKLKDLLTTLTTTVQRQEQALREDRASGGVTAFQAGWNVAQTQGALELTMQELQALKVQLDTLRSRLEEQRRLDQMKLDLLNRSYAQALDMASTVTQNVNQLKDDIIANIS